MTGLATALTEGKPVRLALQAASLPSVLLLVICLIALLAPLIAPYDPVASDPSSKLESPSWQHLFGTDSYGFDIFSRVLFATRTDLGIALASVAAGVLIGLPIGVLSGYVGGALDELIMRLMEVVQGFPQILFAMVVFAALGSSPVNLVIILAILNIPVYVRLVRSVTLPLREAEFVLAARATGNGTGSIVIRHLVPNALVPVFSQFSISAAFAIQLIAGLSFLGLGVPVPEPEWGSMIQIGASQVVFGRWWPALFPGIAVFVTAYALTGVGNQVRQSLSRRIA